MLPLIKNVQPATICSMLRKPYLEAFIDHSFCFCLRKNLRRVPAVFPQSLEINYHKVQSSPERQIFSSCSLQAQHTLNLLGKKMYYLRENVQYRNREHCHNIFNLCQDNLSNLSPQSHSFPFPYNENIKQKMARRLQTRGP